MYIEAVPNRGSPPAILLRQSFRENGRVRKRTLANLSDWPAPLVEGFRTLLKGGVAVAAEGIRIRRALPHGKRQMVGPFIFFDQMGPAVFRGGEGLDVRPHPHIGLATLYRTLNVLCDAGIAQERHFGTQTHYDNVVHKRHHDHMICTQCGLIMEFENCDIEKLQEQVAARHGFTITTHKLELYGLCTKCRR